MGRERPYWRTPVIAGHGGVVGHGGLVDVRSSVLRESSGAGHRGKLT